MFSFSVVYSIVSIAFVANHIETQRTSSLKPLLKGQRSINETGQWMIIRMPPSALHVVAAETLANGCRDPIVGHLETIFASSGLTTAFPERIPGSLLCLIIAERHDRLSSRSFIVSTYVANQVGVFISSDIAFGVVDGLASPICRLLSVGIVAIEIEFSTQLVAATREGQPIELRQYSQVIWSHLELSTTRN